MKKIILFSALIALLASSCEKEVEVKMPPYEPVLVVNTFFESDSTPSVEVLYSKSVNDTARIKKLMTAQVDLYENDAYKGRMVIDTNKNYVLPGFTAVSGKNYKLVINQQGFKEITALSYLPNPVILNSAGYITGLAPGPNSGSTRARLTITFEDPSEENFYFIRMSASRIDTMKIDSVNYVLYPSRYDIYFEEPENSGDDQFFYNGGLLFTDQYINGKNVSMNLDFSEESIAGAQSIDLYFSTVNKEYFKYFKTLGLQEGTGSNPFVEPVRVYSNVTNGLGIFGGTSTLKYKLK
jgi:hypothetical protein